MYVLELFYHCTILHIYSQLKITIYVHLTMLSPDVVSYRKGMVSIVIVSPVQCHLGLKYSRTPLECTAQTPNVGTNRCCLPRRM